MAPGDTDPSSRPTVRRRAVGRRAGAPRVEGRAVAPLQVSICDARGLPVRVPALASWLATIAPVRARGTVTIALVSDARMRALNRTWRGVDRPTDVLSFPADRPAAASRAVRSAPRRRSSRSPEPEAWSPEPGAHRPHLGDIVIATGVAARQARDAGHPPSVEWRVLALHGLLHLLGYDHEQDGGTMDRVERRLRRKGGLAAGLIERAPRQPRPVRREQRA